MVAANARPATTVIAGGSGSDDDSGDYRARRGKGGLGREWRGCPRDGNASACSLRRTRMSTLLDRLGDRVVDLREAYESVTAEKAGEGRGEHRSV